MNYLEKLVKSGSGILKQTKGVTFFLYVVIAVACINYVLAYKTKESNVYYYNHETQQIMHKADTRIQPVRNIETVVNSVDRALFETFNFDSNNYNGVLDEATNNWFTQTGGEQLLSQMINSLISLDGQTFLTSIVENRLTVQAHVLPGTTVIKTGRVNGKLTWHVGARVLFTYRNRLGNGTSELKDMSIWVVERDSSLHPKGIGIQSIKIL